MPNSIRLGLLAGAVISVLMFAPFLLVGPDPAWMEVGEIFGYTSMVLAMSVTYFAMRAERRKRGTLGFGPAFRTGIAVSLVASVVFGLTTWGFLAMMGDTLPQAMVEFYRVKAGDDPAKLAELESMKPLLFNPPLQAALMFATVFLIGLVESLVGAWIVSRSSSPLTAGRHAS
ncbi:MAG TPA: DUF4199 domain-containing protein [Burkholderiaceae bacterium]|nr:DUF4199 domain-containing protein [Burkholderiaceae bacterium]